VQIRVAAHGHAHEIEPRDGAPGDIRQEEPSSRAFQRLQGRLAVLYDAGGPLVLQGA